MFALNQTVRRPIFPPVLDRHLSTPSPKKEAESTLLPSIFSTHHPFVELTAALRFDINFHLSPLRLFDEIRHCLEQYRPYKI